MSNQAPYPTGAGPPPTDSVSARSNAADLLRQRAEAISRVTGIRSIEELEGLSSVETARIVQELCVYHIELEMQNEELLRVQAEGDAARELYFDLYDLAPLGYLTLDERGVIVAANLAAATLWDVPRGTLVDRPFSGAIFRDDEDVFYLFRRKLAKSIGEARSCELRMVKSDGAPFWVELTATRRQVAHGKFELRCILTDISGRKETEEMARRAELDLRAARPKVETGDPIRVTFLAGLSHEVRAPIKVIRGLSQLIRSAGATPEQAGWLDKLDRSSEHLFLLLTQFIELAKLQAGEIPLECVDFEPAPLLGWVASSIGETARAKGLTVEEDAEGVPEILHGDPIRLLQGLLNCALSAARFADKGSIILRAKLLADSGDELLVRFSVEGTDVVDPEQVNRLFAAMSQPLRPMDSAKASKDGGMDLGLAITRELALLMGGEAGADGMSGKDSSLWFTARLQRAGGRAGTLH